MNILFLTLSRFNSIEDKGIYPDLLREFCKNDHKVYVVSITERREGKKTHVVQGSNWSILKIKTGNIQKTNIIEKGISTVLLEQQYKNAIKKYYGTVKFDLVLYCTPPITLVGVVEYIKKRDIAKSYLLLKDIFPQNAVDLGMITKHGIKGVLYNYFRKKELKLYCLSDIIGCMSQANVDYIVKHNIEINPKNVEVCPNCIEVVDLSITSEQRIEIRNKYGVPLNKTVFVYGGNLGKPQGIPFLIECLKKVVDSVDSFFLIVGDGTEYHKIESFINDYKPTNVKLMQFLPKEDYDMLVGACDVGIILLDHRFTIPNFPSRLLSYMQAKIPVFAVTDPNTDIGKVIVDGGFGWWCESDDVEAFANCVQQITKDTKDTKDTCIEYQFLSDNYSAKHGYEIIMKHFSDYN